MSRHVDAEPRRPRLRVHRLGGQTMGTRWTVNLAAPDQADLPRLHHAVQERLDRVVAQMSTWEPESDISRFNRAAAGSWHVLPDDFWQVLGCALDVARRSDGAFDPAIGALVALWGFGADGGRQVAPSAEAIRAAVPSRSALRLQVRAESQEIHQPGGLRLDLSGIAKGFAVDAVAARLQALGIEAALVEVGGELYGYGRKPAGDAWRVLVEHAEDDDADEDDLACVVILDGAAVATSGDRWHRFEQGGRRYSHTLDPRSGAPVAADIASLSVIAASAMQADAWATALTVMGVERALDFAAAHALAARLVARTDQGLTVRATPAFDAHLAA